MPHPCPHHCPPGRSGPAVLAVLAVIAAAALARPVVHAAELALEVAAITAGAVLGLAAVAAVVAVTVTARRRRARVYPVAGRTVREVPAARVRVIEPPRRLPADELLSAEGRPRRRWAASAVQAARRRADRR